MTRFKIIAIIEQIFDNSVEKAIQPAYGTAAVLLMYPLLPEMIHGGKYIKSIDSKCKW